MIKEGALMLTIEGKVSQRVIKKFIPDFVPSKNAGWYFIDFATEEVPLNTKFDVLLEGAAKKLLSSPGAVSIKLTGCFDQFGNKLSAIPKGYNTICKLEFLPQIPTMFNKLLPKLNGWDYNPHAISIAKHEDIEMAVPDPVLKDMFVIINFDIKNKFRTLHISKFSKIDFTTHLEKLYHTPLHADKILESLMQLGKVKRKEGELMEFVEQEEEFTEV